LHERRDTGAHIATIGIARAASEWSFVTEIQFRRTIQGADGGGNLAMAGVGLQRLPECGVAAVHTRQARRSQGRLPVGIVLDNRLGGSTVVAQQDHIAAGFQGQRGLRPGTSVQGRAGHAQIIAEYRAREPQLTP
jgi:hypothetical protein